MSHNGNGFRKANAFYFQKKRKEKGTLLRSSLFWDVMQGRLAVSCTRFETNF